MINSTINSIIESIKNNNTMNSKYLKRINNFFTFFDENNSERLFQQINKISHIKESKFSHYNLIILLMIISIILLKKCINLFSNN